MLNSTCQMLFPLHIEQSRMEQKSKMDGTKIEEFMKATQVHLVLITLLVTITFTVGFSLQVLKATADPYSLNKGMEILLRKTTFCAFVVLDAITFICVLRWCFIWSVNLNQLFQNGLESASVLLSSKTL
ncbi:hypothetical protein BC332_20649 [Capsicum chinense]|nr:hypothetical protein BC332_20649 [Capsicum chinense]